MDKADRPHHCDRPMRKNGKPQGKQRWRCVVCPYSFTEGSLPPHRPPIGDTAMSNADRARKHYYKGRKPKDLSDRPLCCDRAVVSWGKIRWRCSVCKQFLKKDV